MKNEKQLPLSPVRRVVNKATYKPGKGTKVAGLSETLQNDSLTVSQLLLKHINGAQVMTRAGVYADDPNHDDPDVQQYQNMDLSEKMDILEGVRAMTTRLKNLEKEWREEDRKRREGQNKPPEGLG